MSVLKSVNQTDYQENKNTITH